MNTAQKATALLATLLSIVAALLIVAGPELIPANQQHDPVYSSPLFFPYIALSLVIVSGIPLAIKALKGMRIVLDLDVQTTIPRLRLITVILVVFVLYTVLIPWTGYFIASFLFLSITMFLVGFRGVPLLLQALAYSTFLYALFVLGLDVWFPDSWIVEQMQGQ